jgi:hypothetical protein
VAGYSDDIGVHVHIDEDDDYGDVGGGGGIDDVVNVGRQILSTLNRLASSAERIANALEIIAKDKQAST